MRINTCSEAISLAKELENKSARFYQRLSEHFPQDKERFLAFIKENDNYVIQVERAYYGIISDAFEGCFAFDLDPEDYAIQTELTGEASLTEVLAQAEKIEAIIVQFYVTAADQSKSLMADIPRAFKLVAKKRENRLLVLKTLAGKKG